MLKDAASFRLGEKYQAILAELSEIEEKDKTTIVKDALADRYQKIVSRRSLEREVKRLTALLGRESAGSRQIIRGCL